MEDSLNLLWYAFSAAWVAYLVFVLAVSARQKRIWEQIRDIRVRLESAAKR
jgi:hypothetical protein